MARFDEKTLAIIKRLQNARLSLMAKQPFYALLLMNMKFALDLTCRTAYTDGSRVAFNPEFMNEIDDGELEFVLMHEVLHAALAHPFRHQADYKTKQFDLACDIIVNSNILYSFDMDKSKITLKKHGELMHLLPNGEEGYKYSVEEAYDMLLAMQSQAQKGDEEPQENGDVGDGCENDGDELDGDDDSKDDGDGDGGGSGSGRNGKKGKKGKKGKNNQNGENEKENDGKNGKENDGTDEGDREGGGEKPSLEDLIKSIKERNSRIAESLKKDGMGSELTKKESDNKDGRFDDHSFWEGDDENGSMRDTWLERMINATDVIAMTDTGEKGRGTVPLAAERIIKELKEPTLDWRTILNDFVQEEICDYSFTPPDKRMEECPFFLPDFNEKDEEVKNLLFMIDTSASMIDEAIAECYSEIYGAIQQFNGKLSGKLGFFDAVVVEPVPFEDEEEFKIIRPKGGGGTSFHIIFDYVREKMEDDPPVSIIILTDGVAPFPEQDAAMDIPVLWIINNKEIEPPWGKVARMVGKTE